MARRVVDEAIDLNPSSIAEFFADRARRHRDEAPLCTVIYQDHRPDLAAQRDAYEKQTLVPKLRLAADDVVLDLGCGIGRFTPELAAVAGHVHGTDFSPELIQIASARHQGIANASFQAIGAAEVNPHSLDYPSPFSRILIVGLFAYLNDAEVTATLAQLPVLAEPDALILIREPVGTTQRLTLDQVWSDELQATYSAVYRTEAEFRAVFAAQLPSFTLAESSPLYPEHLRNRAETHHHYFVLTRGTV